MQRYHNLSGDSGVTAFELRPHAIVIEFQDGWKYEYTDASAGAAAVRTMHRLATAGRGLSAFVASQVRDGYAHKFR